VLGLAVVLQELLCSAALSLLSCMLCAGRAGGVLLKQHT
jgi:hypothetical protein